MFQSPSLRGSGRFNEPDRRVYHADALFQSPSLRGSGRFEFPEFSPVALSISFNPLHCGAVVASIGELVSLCDAYMFQSPSLRGSGRFLIPWVSIITLTSCFNPLHCGAVVASSIPTISILGILVSIPFIAGQWSLLLLIVSWGLMARVSIPFIAGQWSLQLWEDFIGDLQGCFNPLHCGAVVASRRICKRLRGLFLRFNPLHCGAVVASRGVRS